MDQANLGLVLVYEHKNTTPVTLNKKNFLGQLKLDAKAKKMKLEDYVEKIKWTSSAQLAETTGKIYNGVRWLVTNFMIPYKLSELDLWRRLYTFRKMLSSRQYASLHKDLAVFRAEVVTGLSPSLARYV